MFIIFLERILDLIFTCLQDLNDLKTIYTIDQYTTKIYIDKDTIKKFLLSLKN